MTCFQLGKGGKLGERMGDKLGDPEDKG